MTTREAIAIVREQAAKESGPIREAMSLVATIAEYHRNRNRHNKQRHTRKLNNLSRGCGIPGEAQRERKSLLDSR